MSEFSAVDNWHIVGPKQIYLLHTIYPTSSTFQSEMWKLNS